MRFCGLDLAWSPRNTSGGVILELQDGRGVPVLWDDSLGSDEEILSFILEGTQGRPALVAVDAPLIVPNETGSRPCDRELSAVYRRAEAAAYPVNRRLLGPEVRGEEISRGLAGRGFIVSPVVAARRPVRQIIEVYPHPAMVELFGLERTFKYKARPGRSLEDRRRELGRYLAAIEGLARHDPPLAPWPVTEEVDLARLAGAALKRAEDLLDALLCSYIALHTWWHGPRGYRVFGDGDSGFILVPVSPGETG